MKILIYYPFKYKEGYHAASQLRPRKMAEALARIGQADVLSGSLKLRLGMMMIMVKKILGGMKYDFVYVEVPTYPISYFRIFRVPVPNLMDHVFLLFLKIKGFPIGIFYRDVYWSEVFTPNSEKTPREKLLAVFQKIDLWFYSKYTSVLFLPSHRMLPYVTSKNRFPKVVELPSGCEVVRSPSLGLKEEEGLSVVYVGGVSRKHYDMRLLFESVNDCPSIKLTCVFRKDEWRLVEPDYSVGGSGNIEIIQAHGEKLGEILGDALLGSIIIRPVPYWNFAMPYKLFEYMGFGLPVIASKGTAVGDFIEANDIGWTVDYDKESIRALLVKLNSDRSLVARKAENIKKVISTHTWDARASTVVQTLSVMGKTGVGRA